MQVSIDGRCPNRGPSGIDEADMAGVEPLSD